MSHNIIQHLRRRKHQQTVKIQIPFAAATSPSCFLISDGYIPVSDSDYSCEIFYSGWNYLKSLLCKCLDFIKCHVFYISRFNTFLLCFYFIHLFAYPSFILIKKSFDIFLRDTIRSPYSDT